MDENPSHDIPTSPEGRAAYLDNLAYHAAVDAFKNNKATNSLIIAVMKMNTEKAKLERTKIEAEVKLAEAKVSKIEAEIKQEELYTQAIEAFKGYSGYNG